MPIELHPRPKKSDAPSRLKKTIIAAVIIAVVLLVRSFAFATEVSHTHSHEHAEIEKSQERRGLGGQSEYPFGCESENSKTNGPSYYGYGHCNYHEAFYKFLRKWNSEKQNFSDSCCSGNECRVTMPLEYAPPEFAREGFTHMVMVQGDWYPIKLVEKQTGFTPDDFPKAKKSPMFQEFLQKTHVCASSSFATTAYGADDNETKHAFLIRMSGYIYCVMDGGDKS